MTKRHGLLPVVFALVFGGAAVAGDVERATETVDAEGAERIVVECDFAAGDMWVRTDDMADAAILNVTYEPRYVDYFVDYKLRREVGYLELESDLRRHIDVNKVTNEWELVLSTRYETELTMEIGACNAEMDFGGLPITELRLDIGAASGVIEFSKPNPKRMELLDIDVGAASVIFKKLGNANFGELNFDCGASSADLDLRGEFRGESRMDVSVGVGSANIVIPEGLAVRVEGADDHWLSSVDIDDLDLERVRRGIYESEDFQDATDRLIIDLDVGMGSVEVYRR
jgi:hypothetical protein